MRKKEELLNELNNKKDMLMTIEKTTIQQMWINDLDAFDEQYKKYINERLSELDNTQVVSKKKSKVKT